MNKAIRDIRPLDHGVDSAPVITFDFDRVGEWGPKLSQHLRGLVPDDAGQIIRRHNPEYIEDAADVLFSTICRDKASIVSAVSVWIKSQTVAAYHGSRLDDADIEAIRKEGLLALAAEHRRTHLVKKLSAHPQWPQHESRLGAVLDDLGNRNKAGSRQSQAHATLSRAGLVRGFNHYLTHGSEFDQHAAASLLGDDGKELLGLYGQPVLVTLGVPGPAAFKASNPWPELTREMPNQVRETIQLWAHWLAHPGFVLESGVYDCGLIFFEDVPHEWIVRIEHVRSEDLLRDPLA